jgi:hypothetical protein
MKAQWRRGFKPICIPPLRNTCTCVISLTFSTSTISREGNTPLGHGWRPSNTSSDHTRQPGLVRNQTTRNFSALLRDTTDVTCHVPTTAPCLSHDITITELYREMTIKQERSVNRLLLDVNRASNGHTITHGQVHISRKNFRVFLVPALQCPILYAHNIITSHKTPDSLHGGALRGFNMSDNPSQRSMFRYAVYALLHGS